MSDEGARDQTREDKPALGGDFVIPVLALAFAGYFFWSIDDLEWEARANGTVIGTILVALIAVQVFSSLRTILRGQATFAFSALLDPREVLGKRILLLLILVAFVGFLDFTGATLGLLLMMIASMLLLGVRDWRILAGVSLVVAATVYVLFIAILKAKLPHGPIEKLLALIPGLGG